ncbi:putative mitochondrial 37S ribosomal protein [Clavispora lusitaniae]|uniref:Mitochondrial 37S ribosomal protein n=1 Tax=Clavispora lusitaniae TaxID=36911 RepID=A0AA91PVI8_CLALS|nr:putative mitochondrial 37S ribosomal protein [Clavispora lusitaniae]
MLGLYGRVSKSTLITKVVARSSSTAIDVSSVEESLSSQKQLREKALAEALAREEEAIAREKALRELKNKTKESISILNSTPSNLIRERLQSLQSQLNQLEDQDKVKRLDKEMESFLFENMKLSPSEIGHRPWFERTRGKITTVKPSEEQEIVSQKIKTTTSSAYTNQYPNLKPTPDYKPYSSQELFLRQLTHMRQSGGLGSSIEDVYNPANDVKRPLSMDDVTISSLMAAGCHLGHAKAMWRPSTQPFIYAEYQGIHLIDLNETLAALRRATKVIESIAAKGGVILYVGTSRNWEQHRALEEAAKRSRGYYVSHRWIPGTITNFTEVSKQIGGHQKIEVDLGDTPTNRNISAQDDALIKPDLVVLLNPVENRNCVNECIKSRIPTIGLCDTDMEPSLLTYPIPCNDDSMRASSVVCGILSKAAEQGVERRYKAFSEYKSSQK